LIKDSRVTFKNTCLSCKEVYCVDIPFCLFCGSSDLDQRYDYTMTISVSEAVEGIEYFSDKAFKIHGSNDSSEVETDRNWARDYDADCLRYSVSTHRRVR
jgi:hypothetical protein